MFLKWYWTLIPSFPHGKAVNLCPRTERTEIVEWSKTHFFMSTSRSLICGAKWAACGHYYEGCLLHHTIHMPSLLSQNKPVNLAAGHGWVQRMFAAMTVLRCFHVSCCCFFPELIADWFKNWRAFSLGDFGVITHNPRGQMETRKNVAVYILIESRANSYFYLCWRSPVVNFNFRFRSNAALHISM